MLLVHGLGGSLIDWRDVAEPLARHHRAWSIDLVGFGRTPRAGRPATLQTNQGVVDRVITTLFGDEPAVLVGNSMGGLISILEAARRPERVRSLVLVDPALPAARGGHVSLMIAAAFLVMTTPRIGPWLVDGSTRRRGAERVVDDVLRLCTVDVRRISAETRDAQVELFRWRQDQDEPHRAFLEASKSLMQWLWHRETVERYIAGVRAPTLLIHGDSDNLVSLRASTKAAQLRPDWSFRVMADTGHIPQLERPRDFVDVVEGWLEVGQRPARASTSRR